MKKYLVLLLATAMVLTVLTGCGAAPVVAPEPTPAATPEPTPEPRPEELAMEEAERLFFEERDRAAAVDWMVEHEDLHYAPMQALLGSCYYQGWGTAEDNDKAYAQFDLAAEQGNACGLYGKARCMDFGYGTGKNTAAAQELYAQAVEALESAADGCEDRWVQGIMCFYLGSAYAFGQGTEKDEAKALAYWEKGAALDNAKALLMAGHAYYNIWSDWVSPVSDKKEALAFYERAAAGGEREAMFLAGYMYHLGQGTEPDFEKARSYYEMAQAAGEPNASHWLSQLKQDMAAAEKAG